MNSFGSRSVLRVGNREFEIYRLDAVEKHGCSIKHLPYSLRILLENLLRREDGKSVKADDVRSLTAWTRQGSDPGDRFHAQPGAAAGLHGRAGGGRFGGHAGGDEGSVAVPS